MIHVFENGIRRQVMKPTTSLRIAEGYVRENGPYPKGHIHAGHQHYADHWMVIRQGPLLIRVEAPHGCTQYHIEAPNLWFVRADRFHEIEVIGDVGHWDCLFTAEQLAAANVAPELAHRERR